jgi:hypothetical protein
MFGTIEMTKKVGVMELVGEAVLGLLGCTQLTGS